tara:strand:+ start:454 stop:582 length:129 start_codon:yes stop_codon:yes gene_type:complete
MLIKFLMVFIVSIKEGKFVTFKDRLFLFFFFEVLSCSFQKNI